MLGKYQQKIKEKRDKKIYKEKLSGKYSNMELANKYHMTYARLLQIVNEQKLLVNAEK